MFKDLFIISLTPLVCKYHRILTKGVEAPHVTPDVLVVWGPRDTRRCTGRWAELPWPIYTPGTLPWSWTAGGTWGLYTLLGGNQSTLFYTIVYEIFEKFQFKYLSSL